MLSHFHLTIIIGLKLTREWYWAEDIVDLIIIYPDFITIIFINLQLMIVIRPYVHISQLSTLCIPPDFINHFIFLFVILIQLLATIICTFHPLFFALTCFISYFFSSVKVKIFILILIQRLSFQQLLTSLQILQQFYTLYVLTRLLLDLYYNYNMNGKSSNNLHISQESITRSIESIDGAFLGIEDSNPPNDLQELEKEFQMNLADYEKDVQEEVAYILVKLLEYPSTHEAQGHQNANRLGLYDLKSIEEAKSQLELPDESKIFCKDCGLVIQPSSIPLCTDFSQFPKMGIAGYLFFQTIKNMTVLLFLLACFYCSYSLYVNITEPSTILSSENYILKFSFGSTIQNLETNPSLYGALETEGWLIAGGVFFWWVTLFLMKRNALKQQRMVDDMTITPADFSIMLDHVPITATKDSLQKDLDQYYQLLKDKEAIHGKQNLRPFKIKKICKAVPFYFLDEQSIKEKIEEIEGQISEKRQKISALLEQVKSKGNFITSTEDRKAMYADYLKLFSDQSHQERQLKELCKNFNCIENQDLKTAVFITFQCSESANAIEAANPRGLAAKMRYYLSCGSSGIYYQGDTEIVTCRAPEPEDIIWENIGIPDCSVILRKMVTYFVTVLLLGISFGVAYGFTMLQMTYSSMVITFGISLSITVINMVIEEAIRKLTIYESDITSTNHQSGLALKCVFAQLTNSTLVPIITNIYIEQNMFETDGLVDQIFYLGITAAFLAPILKLIDIPYRINQFKIWYYRKPHQKLKLSQKQLNEMYKYSEIQLGVEYIYFIDLFYFTCFYVYVQPCVVIFSFLGFFFMYWVNKYCLLTRTCRPTPSSALLNETMSQLVGFGPCMLSLGQFVWFNLIRQDFHNFNDSTFISHLVALGCSALFFLLPFNIIFNIFCSIPDDEDLIYDEVRSQLTSDYELLNPATADEALQEFLQTNQKPSMPQQPAKQANKKPAMQLEISTCDEKSPMKRNAKVVKVAKNGNQLTQESLAEPIQEIIFLPDVSLEEENTMDVLSLAKSRNDPATKRLIPERKKSDKKQTALKQRG